MVGRRGDAVARRRPPPDDTDAVVSGLVGFGLLLGLPLTLSLCLGPPRGVALAFALVIAYLLATRPRGTRGFPPERRAGALRARPVLEALAAGLAAGAGLLALPAWLALIGGVGGALGLAPRGASPPIPPASFQAGVSVLLAPALEELLYRERLLPPLRRRLGTPVAVATTSALFALPHAEPWAVLGTFLVGLALGGLLCAGRSTALCVGYHAGLNLAGLLCGVPPVRGALRPPVAALAGGTLVGIAVRIARAARGRGPRPLAVAMVLLWTLPAAAERLSWVGTLSLDLLAAGPSPISTARGVATVNGSGGGLALETLRLTGTALGSSIVPITDPLVSAAGPVGLRLAGGPERGTLAPFFPPVSPGATQLTRATLPLRGSLRLCLFSIACGTGVSLALASGAAGSTVGLGVGGLVVASPYGPAALSLLGAPWTVRTATLTAQTTLGALVTVFSTGGVHGPLSATGSTGIPGGSVALVSPFVTQSLSADGGFTGFGRLAIRFVPEPRPLAALAVGAVGLWIARHRRLRRLPGD
jgi:membrane protease YdiL (CAAX protease family)